MTAHNGSRSLTLLLVATVFLLVGSATLSGDIRNTDNSFVVHGRLSIYVGNPLFRIWIVGTNRILGVPGGDAEPAEMPEKLAKLFTKPGIVIYGDFTLTPLTEYRPGVMQFVRIESAKNLAVYRRDEFLKRLPKL